MAVGQVERLQRSKNLVALVAEKRNRNLPATRINEALVKVRPFGFVPSTLPGSHYSSTICRLSVSGYSKFRRSAVYSTLNDWLGSPIADRGETVEEYRPESFVSNRTYAIVFRLPRGRFIAGYTLGDGMLFRGELFEGTFDEAKRFAINEAERWLEIDAEDEDADNEEDTPE